MVEVERQVLVGLDIGPDDLGDHLLVGRTVEHVAVVAVLDAQHLLAVGVVAPRLAPEIGGLDGGHQKLDRAGAILLLLDDLLHLHEHLVAERQPGIEAGGLLTDHAGTQHQPMRDNFGFLGNVTQHRQEIAGKAHGNSEERMIDSRVSLMPTQIASVHSMQACKLCRIYLADRKTLVRVPANKTKAAQTAGRRQRQGRSVGSRFVARLRPTYCRTNSFKQGLVPCFFVSGSCVYGRFSNVHTNCNGAARYGLRAAFRSHCLQGQTDFRHARGGGNERQHKVHAR
ncbi:hypothetical protein D3C87_1416130 [compost metagenome]